MKKQEIDHILVRMLDFHRDVSDLNRSHVAGLWRSVGWVVIIYLAVEFERYWAWSVIR